MVKPPPSDPLRPLEIGANALIIFSVVFAVFIAVIVLLVPGGSLSAIGLDEKSVCANTTIGEWTTDGAGGDAVMKVRDQPADTTEQSDGVFTLCTSHPGLGLKAADVITKAPRFLQLFGLLLLVKVLIRCGRREGLFNLRVARGVQLIGWYILLTTIAVSALRMTGTALLLKHMAPRDFGVETFIESFRLSIGLLLVGAGVITVARVLRQAVTLREEVDATI